MAQRRAERLRIPNAEVEVPTREAFFADTSPRLVAVNPERSNLDGALTGEDSADLRLVAHNHLPILSSSAPVGPARNCRYRAVGRPPRVLFRKLTTRAARLCRSRSSCCQLSERATLRSSCRRTLCHYASADLSVTPCGRCPPGHLSKLSTKVAPARGLRNFG